MKNAHKISLISVLLLAIILTVFAYRDSIVIKWHEYKLNKEFVCPENQTQDQVEIDAHKFSSFYLNNYPSMTFDAFLAKRIEVLISHNCVVSLKNIGDKADIESPDLDLVKKLKNTPYGPNNLTLKELSK